MQRLLKKGGYIEETSDCAATSCPTSTFVIALILLCCKNYSKGFALHKAESTQHRCYSDS